MADLKELRIGEKFAGRYRVVEVIGAGPIGRVYKALDLALDIPVAIKTLNPGLFTGEFAQVNVIRLYRARAYKNPALLEILEVQPEGPVPFVTSALAQGLSLRQVMDFHHETGEAFTVMKIRSFMERIFEGMEFIHTMGVHGNIKPENIFILSTHLAIADPYYILEKRLLEGEEIPITDFYRPPEQLEAPQRESKASDIYSIAMVMGELVSNEPVHPGISLSEQTPRLTSRFDAAFMRATLQRHEQRHKSVSEFAKEIFAAIAAVEQEGLWERKHHETGSFRAVKIPEEPGVTIEKLPEAESTEKDRVEPVEKKKRKTAKLYPIAEEEIEKQPLPEQQAEEPVAVAKEEEPAPAQEILEETGEPSVVEKPEEQQTEEPVATVKEEEPAPAQEILEETGEPSVVEKPEEQQEEKIVPPPATETETVDAEEKEYDEETEAIEEIAGEEESTQVLAQDELPVKTADDMPETELEELDEIDVDEMPELEEYEELNDEELIEAPGVETEAVEMDEEPEDTLVQTVQEVEKVAEHPVPAGKMAGFEKITGGQPTKKKESDNTYLWVGIGVALLVIVLAFAFSGGKKGKKKMVKIKGTAPIVKIQKDAKINKNTTKKHVKDVATVTKKDAKDAVNTSRDAKIAKDAQKKLKDTKTAKKTPEKPARKAGFIYAADLKCPVGMAKITIKKETEAKPGLKLTKLAYCIDRYEYPGRGRMPMGNVSAGKAAGLCKKTGKRLCTTSEWKRACGMKYPYGNKFIEGVCNVAASDGTEHTIAPSGTYNKCRSAYGVYDMVGNVEEWTSSRRLFGGNVATSAESTTCSRNTKRFLPNRFSGFRCCAVPGKGPSR